MIALYDHSESTQTERQSGGSEDRGKQKENRRSGIEICNAAARMKARKVQGGGVLTSAVKECFVNRACSLLEITGLALLRRGSTGSGSE